MGLWGGIGISLTMSDSEAERMGNGFVVARFIEPLALGPMNRVTTNQYDRVEQEVDSCYFTFRASIQPEPARFVEPCSFVILLKCPEHNSPISSCSQLIECPTRKLSPVSKARKRCSTDRAPRTFWGTIPV